MPSLHNRLCFNIGRCTPGRTVAKGPEAGRGTCNKSLFALQSNDAGSLNKLCGNFQQLRFAERLGKQSSGAEGLRQAFTSIAADERKGDVMSRQCGRDIVDRPPVQVSVEQCRIQWLAYNDVERLARRAR